MSDMKERSPVVQVPLKLSELECLARYLEQLAGVNRLSVPEVVNGKQRKKLSSEQLRQLERFVRGGGYPAYRAEKCDMFASKFRAIFEENRGA